MRTRKLPLFAVVMCGIGCGLHTGPAGPTQHESRSIDRDAAETLRAEVRMGGGTLKIRGGAPNWLQGDFTYNVPSWKPNIRYAPAGSHGYLTIEQPNSSSVNLSNTTNEWDLRLNNEIPTDVAVRLGGGEARLELGTLSLRGVDIEIGAGELRLDLRGKPTRSYDVRIRGGAGEATVYAPRDVGVYAKAKGGLGEIKVQGLRAEGEHWVNDAYATSKIQIRLDVQGGVGSINLIAE